MERTLYLLVVLATIGLFFFLLLKIDVFNDEAFSYYMANRLSISDIVLYRFFTAANNHVINSLWLKLLAVLKIKSLFVFRLLSFVSFVIYLTVVIKLLQLLNLSKWYFLIFAFFPHFQYFVLARGYSLAMAMFVVALYLLLKFKYFPEYFRRAWCTYLLVFSGIISMVSIFSFMYGVIILFLFYFLYRFREIKRLDKHFIIQGILILLAVVYIYYAGKIINEKDLYIIGSDSLIKNGTLGSVLSDLTFFNFLKVIKFYSFIKYGFVIILTIAIGSLLLKSPIDFVRKNLELVSLLIGPVILMVLSHLLFGAKYPINRAVMYLEFTFLLLLIIAIKSTKLAVLPVVYYSLLAIIALYFQFRAIFQSKTFKEIFSENKIVVVHDYLPMAYYETIKDLYNLDTKVYKAPNINELENIIEKINGLQVKDFVILTRHRIDKVDLQNYKIIDSSRCQFKFKIYYLKSTD